MGFAKTTTVTAAAMFCASAALAGQQGHAPVHVAPMHATAPATHGAAATTHGSAAAHGAAAKSTTTTTHGSARASTAGPHATGASSSHATTTRTASTKKATTMSGTTTSSTPSASATGAPSTGTRTGTAAPPSPIAAKIQSHPQLAAKVNAMLPQGMTMNRAAAGFKNQGQFIAALHVSQNLGIPFADLKKQMVTNHRSLGQAIQQLTPGANATTEAAHGETEADHDVRTTTNTTRSVSISGTASATTTTTTMTATPTVKHGRNDR